MESEGYVCLLYDVYFLKFQEIIETFLFWPGQYMKDKNTDIDILRILMLLDLLAVRCYKDTQFVRAIPVIIS